MTRGLVFLCVCGLFGFSLLAGCKKAANPPVADNPSAQPGAGKPTPPEDIDPSDKFATAKATFRTNCARCHSTSAGGRGKAPNLAKVGGNPEHTKDWLADHIRDPQAHKPESKMPKFGNKLKPDDIKALADYLASLK